MAQEWCVAYGVMDENNAKKAYKAMVKRKEKEKSSRGKSPPPPSKSSTSGKKKNRGKKVLDDVEFDAGMTAGGDEGIGMAAL